MGNLKNKKSLSKKIAIMGVIAISVFVIGFALLIPHEVNAAIFDIGAKTLTFIVKFVLNLIQWIVGILIKLAVWLVGFVLDLNASLVDDIESKNSFVYVGWTAIRDVTNLGFVLGIIMIAVGIMLRYGGYTIEKTLSSLIIAALLVNFSLVIASVPLRVSDVFSNFFLKQISGGDVSLSSQATNRIAQAFKYEKLVLPNTQERACLDGQVIKEANELCQTDPDKQDCFNRVIQENCTIWSDDSDPDMVDEALGVLANEATQIMTIVISSFVGIMILLVLICFGGMLFVRYFKLAFLLIMSPAVCLMWIFPQTQKWWKRWWQEFTHWTLYAPFMLFFLWLTLETNRVVSDQYSIRAGGVVGSGDPSVGLSSFRNMIAPIMVVFFMVAGMKIASQLGFAGTDIAQKMVSKTKSWGEKKMLRAGRRVTSGTLNSAPGKWARGAAIKLAQNKRLQGIGLDKIAQGLETVSTTSQRASGEYLREQQKEFSALDDDQLIDLLPTTTGERRVALLKLIGERGLLQKDKTKKILGATDLQLLESELSRRGDKKAVASFIDKMDPKQLAQFHGSLGMGSPLRKEVALAVAAKGAASGSGIDYGEIRELYNGLMEAGERKKAEEFLSQMGMSPAVLKKIGEYQAAPAGSTERARLTQEISDELTRFKEDQSAEAFALSMKNVATSTARGAYPGVDPSIQTLMQESLISYAVDNPTQGLRPTAKPLDAQTDRADFHKEVIRKKLEWMREYAATERSSVTQALNNGGYTSLDLADKSKLKSDPVLRKIKEQDDRATLLERQHREFEGQFNGVTDGDYRDFAKRIANPQTSSLREMQELGRSIRV